MKKNYLKISILIFLTFVSYSQTFACSCIMPEGPNESLNNASSVFIGRVDKIEQSSIANELLGDYRRNIVSFNVKNSIKGNLSNNVTITTARDSATCGYNFEEGKEYIVYTHGEGRDLEVSLCSRTAEIVNATEDLEAFKEILQDSKINDSLDEGQIKNTFYKEIELYISIILILISIYIISLRFKTIKD
ncbi:MAG: hypothetical protein PHH98_03240 [Candidatus Gracilibacteria bacterium]|nr:hypothetical protein [Candidatus Gracilibacteria bacterium]